MGLEYELPSETNLANIVKQKGIWFRKLEIEYRKSKKMILVRFEGAKSMPLPDKYKNEVDKQLRTLETNFLTPLIGGLHSNFVLHITVNSQGQLSLMNIDLKIKLDCGKGIGMINYFYEPFRILLPYALYITNVDFRGHKNKITVVEAEVSIPSDELIEIINQPIVSPRARDQWNIIGSTIYLEAQEEYRYEVSVPCIEGELYWDSKVNTVQVTLYEDQFKKFHSQGS